MKSNVHWEVLLTLSEEFISHGKIGEKPSPRTQKNRRIFIRNLLRFLNKDNFNQETALNFISSKERAGAKLNTIRTEIKNVCALANWLVKKGHLSNGFSEEISQPKVQKCHRTFHSPLVYEQVIFKGSELSEGSNKTHKIQNLEARFACLFILTTGCRISEALNLQGKDITTSEEKVEVLLHRKGGGTDVKEVVDLRVQQVLRERTKREKVFPVTQELLRRTHHEKPITIENDPFWLQETIEKGRFSDNNGDPNNIYLLGRGEKMAIPINSPHIGTELKPFLKHR